MAKTLTKKVVPDRTYEVTYLVSSGLTSSELTAVNDEVIALVGKYKGKVKETQDWGKKPLAYVIKKDGKDVNEAYYTHLIIEMKADKAPALTRELELKKAIVRSLVVKVE